MDNITCFDMPVFISQQQNKSSFKSRTGNIRDSFIFSPLRGLCRAVLSKWETLIVKENDYFPDVLLI